MHAMGAASLECVHVSVSVSVWILTFALAPCTSHLSSFMEKLS